MPLLKPRRYLPPDEADYGDDPSVDSPDTGQDQSFANARKATQAAMQPDSPAKMGPPPPPSPADTTGPAAQVAEAPPPKPDPKAGAEKQLAALEPPPQIPGASPAQGPPPKPNVAAMPPPPPPPPSAYQRMQDLSRQRPERPRDNVLQTIGKIALAPVVGPAADAFIHPRYTQEMADWRSRLSDLETQSKIETEAASKGALEEQRKATAEKNRAQAADYPLREQERQNAIEERDRDSQRRAFTKIVGPKQTPVYQDPGAPVAPGFTALIDPDVPGKVAVVRSGMQSAPKDLVEGGYLPGYKTSDPIPLDILQGGYAAFYKDKLATDKPQKQTPQEQAIDIAASEAAQKLGINLDPKKTWRSQIPLQQQAGVLQRAKELNADPELRDATLAAKAAAQASAAAAQGTRADKRADDSYKYHNNELGKLRKPIDDGVARLGRLKETLAQGTPQADALVAPELLTVMAGGQGSGLRMNEAEIARIIGGRSKLESLKAAAQQWSLNPATANSITPEQRRQIRDLVKAVDAKLLAKQQAVADAQDSLIESTNPMEHRRILGTAQRALATVDQGARGSSRTSNGSERLPKGQQTAPDINPNPRGYVKGHVYGGMTYLGGDPNNAGSWKK